MRQLPHSWIIAAAILIGLILWMVSGSVHDRESSSAEQPAAADSLPVVTTTVSVTQPMIDRLTLTGRTVANRTVVVKAETAGIVVHLGAERGAEVSADDMLVQLANDHRDARAQQARSELAQAQTGYDAARALRREGFQARIELARAQATLDSARAALRLAELELARTRVQAPIAGVINERFVEIGDFVDRGQALVQLVDLNPIRVVAQLSERYLGQVAVGASGTARMVSGAIYKGQISYVGHVAGDLTRTFPVELQIDNADGFLIEGITAELVLPAAPVQAHRIPASAVSLSDDGQLGVKSLASDGTVAFHAITILGDADAGIWAGGLPERLYLITTGQAFVQPGQTVLSVSQRGG